jgi:hypothetical protein
MMAKQAPRYQTFITAHLCIIGGGDIGTEQCFYFLQREWCIFDRIV